MLGFVELLKTHETIVFSRSLPLEPRAVGQRPLEVGSNRQQSDLCAALPASNCHRARQKTVENTQFMGGPEALFEPNMFSHLLTSDACWLNPGLEWNCFNIHHLERHIYYIILNIFNHLGFQAKPRTKITTICFVMSRTMSIRSKANERADFFENVRTGGRVRRRRSNLKAPEENSMKLPQLGSIWVCWVILLVAVSFWFLFILYFDHALHWEGMHTCLRE